LDLNWGEGFEREGLGERGGHVRVMERELGARERVCAVVRVRERYKCYGAQNHQLELDRSDRSGLNWAEFVKKFPSSGLWR
jgi:hypothetical protein